MDPLSFIIEQIDLFAQTIDVRTILIYSSLGYVGIIWLALIIWTIRDSYNRSHNFLFFFFSFVLVLFFNIFGLIIYLIIRPQTTLQTRKIEKVTLNTLHERTTAKCPSCRKKVSTEFLYCPYCKKEIVNSCLKCKKPIDKKWEICPYCGKTKTSRKSTKKVHKKQIGV